MHGCVNASYVDLAKFFGVLEHVIELSLKIRASSSVGVELGQPCDVGDIEV